LNKEIEKHNGLIKELSPELSNKIAAGEVIQRPSSVVKELLDNAIDSGADHIRVIIQNAGRTLIQVIDNGCGMSKEDIPLCFLRHATSKIHEVNDLFNIQTMGFRGEAMASISAVSQVTLKTKKFEDEMGYEYEVWGNKVKNFEPAAVDNGTSVAVRNLFYNVPARRAFLKTDATEFRHILITFQQAALANADISFELIADTDSVYNLPAGPLDQRIVEIFGKSYRASLIPVEEKTSYVNVWGYVIDPKMAKKNRGEQFLFVNNRPFYHRYILHIILNIYRQWIQPNEYPFFALFYDINPQEVDVNVHPSKLEVKFGDERSVTAFTRSIVKKALNERFNVPVIGRGESPGGKSYGDFESGFSFGKSGDTSINRSGGDSIQFPSRINFDKRRGNRESLTDELYGGFGGNPQGIPGKYNTGSIPQPEYDKGRGFWQLHDRYIISQTLTGLFIIDQHSAHKRIIYEKALQATESALPSTQQLLFPQTIEFSASDFSLLKELHPIIQKMGFNIQLLSGNTAMVLGVPADIKMGDERHLLESILQQYQDLSSQLKLKDREKVALAMANKASIPRGKKLNDMEMERLIDQLFSCKEPYLDPLEKPTIVYIPLDEIESRFR